MADHRTGRRGWTDGEIAAVSGVVLLCIVAVCFCAQRYAGWRLGYAVAVALFFPGFGSVAWALGFWHARQYIDQ
jgi:hypothetical protein